MRCGVRCAEYTPTSYGTSNSASAWAAASMTDQSESLPMITPTTGSDMRALSFPAPWIDQPSAHSAVDSHAAASTARSRTTTGSSPSAVTWPILRAGRAALPYRWILTSGNRANRWWQRSSMPISGSTSAPRTFAITTAGAVSAVEPSG